jgi:hypothetical protein
MTAEPNELKRQPRRIGPKPIEEVPDAGMGEDGLTQQPFSAFLDTLSTEEMLDLDDAAGGVMFRDEVQVTTRVVLACAWIWLRRVKPRLAWRQVLSRPRAENMTLIAEFMEATTAVPKDDAPAPDS